MKANTMTHKNEDAISIFLPALGHLVILFLCCFRVYGEEQSRAVGKARISKRWLLDHLVVLLF